MVERSSTLEGVVTFSVASEPLAELIQSRFAKHRVLISGDSGFVGGWLAACLSDFGADVMGVSLPSDASRISAAASLRSDIREVEADIRDLRAVERPVTDFDPEVVFHLAAQALVIPSYEDPVWTFETNVLGTAHILDALRRARSIRSCVVITSDKCYATRDGMHSESDALGGDDPYSASKAAAEIVTHAYRTSFLAARGIGVATARAGNILGGGDIAEHRVIPDCIRAIETGVPVALRHPEAVRPWQHVLDAVAGYLRLAAALLDDPEKYDGAWNFGPRQDEETSVDELVHRFISAWRERGGVAHEAVDAEGDSVGERVSLLLDSAKARNELGWRPCLDIARTIDWTAEWYFEVMKNSDAAADMTSRQIAQYIALEHANLADSAPSRGARRKR